MTYEDIPRVAQLKIKPERFIKIKEEIKIKNNQIRMVQDIFKPGINEIGAMLPRKIGQFFIRNNKIMSFLPFIGKGMRINSLTIFGFLSLKFLSVFRYIRTISLRYNEEQKSLDIWINNIIIAFSKSLTFAEGLADMPQILKGYGDTWDRGKIKYNMINRALVENKMDDLNNSKGGEILKQAILISMNDTEVENLEVFLKKNS
jgi:indolepyruvate ferredoxin oxidoreductase beta subunit